MFLQYLDNQLLRFTGPDPIVAWHLRLLFEHSLLPDSAPCASVQYLDNQLLRFTGPDPGPPARTAKQVVLLGAGMDTRAWRLELPPGIK